MGVGPGKEILDLVDGWKRQNYINTIKAIIIGKKYIVYIDTEAREFGAHQWLVSGLRGMWYESTRSRGRGSSPKAEYRHLVYLLK